jgi:hypothetical protein
VNKGYLKSKVCIATFVALHVEQLFPNCKEEQIINFTLEPLGL